MEKKQEALNTFLTDDIIVRQLEKKLNELTKERSHLLQKIEKLSSLVKLQDKTISEFKQWREKFILKEMDERFEEMKSLMEDKEIERRMLKQLSKFFTENKEYKRLVSKLNAIYGTMIQREVNARLNKHQMMEMKN